MTDKKENHSPQVVTFGCRLNIYESELIKQHAKTAGLKDTIIVNTCAVTSEAERQSRQSIRKLRRDNPDSKIIVTGCAAQINTKTYAEMDEINQVIGNDEKLKLETYMEPSTEKVQVDDIMSVKETAHQLITGFENHARAFAQLILALFFPCAAKVLSSKETKPAFSSKYCSSPSSSTRI